jgi:hypothetical protein
VLELPPAKSFENLFWQSLGDFVAPCLGLIQRLLLAAVFFISKVSGKDSLAMADADVPPAQTPLDMAIYAAKRRYLGFCVHSL